MDGTNALRACIADVTPLLDGALFERELALVWPERQAHTLCYAAPLDRCLSLGAALLLRRCLIEAGMEPLAMRIVRDRYGKSRFDGQDGAEFSLAHAGIMAAAVLSEGPVGIDLERVDAPLDIPAGRVFTPEEQAWLENGEPSGYGQRLVRLWTRKEAFLKAIGTGFGNSRALQVSVHPGSGEIHHAGQRWEIHESSQAEEYLLALSCQNNLCFSVAEISF